MERTQPGLSLGVGQIRTRTHDYKRHGTITLFAALKYLVDRNLHPKSHRWKAACEEILRKIH
ncbi:MAG: IS630 family transposase, partial [Spirochaetaceae bacterium]|nr:IS630 family transposase [Spirochaetaceae bacterium]